MLENINKSKAFILRLLFIITQVYSDELIAAPNPVELYHSGEMLTVSEKSARQHVLNHESDYLGPCGRGEIYGVDKQTKRMNDFYTACQFERFAARAGVEIELPGSGSGDYCTLGDDSSGADDVNHIDTAFILVAVSFLTATELMQTLKVNSKTTFWRTREHCDIPEPTIKNPLRWRKSEIDQYYEERLKKTQ